jgi:hypothetical protein
LTTKAFPISFPLPKNPVASPSPGVQA